LFTDFLPVFLSSVLAVLQVKVLATGYQQKATGQLFGDKLQSLHR